MQRFKQEKALKVYFHKRFPVGTFIVQTPRCFLSTIRSRKDAWLNGYCFWYTFSCSNTGSPTAFLQPESRWFLSYDPGIDSFIKLRLPGHNSCCTGTVNTNVNGLGCVINCYNRYQNILAGCVVVVTYHQVFCVHCLSQSGPLNGHDLSSDYSSSCCCIVHIQVNIFLYGIACSLGKR